MERTISLPDDLLAQIDGIAIRQGKSVDQWLEAAARAQLEDRTWHICSNMDCKQVVHPAASRPKYPKL